MKQTPSLALVMVLTALGCASNIPLAAAAKSPAHAPEKPALTAVIAATAEAATQAALPTAFSFAHVIHDGGVRVLVDPNPDDAWASSAPKLLSKGSPVVARRAVDLAKLPADLAASVGRKVELMRAGDRVCEATITGLSLIGRVEPYFGARADWDGSGEPGKKPLRADEIADEAWKLADPGGHALAAELGDVKGDCSSATWARDVAAARPRVAKAHPAAPELTKRALDALRKLSSYSEIQGAFEQASELPQKSAAWEQSDDTELIVSEMSFGEGDRSWVWVSARTRESCGPFYGELSALFEVREGPLGVELSVRYEERATPGSEPEAAIDAASEALGGATGAGKVDVLFTGARLHPISSRYQLDAALVPFLDCPC